MTWKPHPGAQTEFCSRGEFEALYGGSAGPGKTDCVVALAARRAHIPGYRGVVLRRTFPQLQEIIDRCWKLYPAMGGIYRATEHRWIFPGGGLIHLGHMQHEQDKYNYTGREYHFVGWDELTQFSETQYTYIVNSRIRSTNPHIPTRVRASTNPGGIGHNWVKAYFVTNATPKTPYVDPRTGHSRVFIPGVVYDNPTIMENDPAYVSRLEGLPNIEKRRLLYGDWDTFEGQVFGQLSALTHGCEPFDIPPEWEKYCVLDWGFAKPFSVHWYALDYDGNMWLYREWYGCKDGEQDVGIRMPAYEVAKGILEREQEKIRMRLADPSIWNKQSDLRRNEVRGPSVAEDMQSEGVYFIKADNDRMHGIQQVHKRIQLQDDVDVKTGEIMGESPTFHAFNTCSHFWRTVPTLQSDPRHPEDVDTEQEDHAYDTFRYMCMSRPVKPRVITSMPSGSFAKERKRLIRAQAYARAHGVSMSTAYTRCR